MKTLRIALILILSLQTFSLPHLYAQATDPCASGVKTTSAFSFASSTAQQLIAPAAGKRNFVCAIHAQAQGTGETLNILEGTQSSAPCDTAVTALDGSTTAANGNAMVANGGWSYGNGAGTVYSGKSVNAQTCAVTSGSNRVTVTITWIQK